MFVRITFYFWVFKHLLKPIGGPLSSRIENPNFRQQGRLCPGPERTIAGISDVVLTVMLALCFSMQWSPGRLTGLKEEHGHPSQILFVEPMSDFCRLPGLWWKEDDNPRVGDHRKTPGFCCLWFLGLVLINIVSKTWSSCPDDELSINGDTVLRFSPQSSFCSCIH